MAVAARAERHDPLAGVVLEDSTTRRWALADLAGAPVLLALADGAGSRQALAWGREIATARPGRLAPWRHAARVPMVSVADLRAIPSVARTPIRLAIRALLAGRVPPEAPQLLLDWDAVLARRWDAASGVATLVLLDGARRVRAREAGPPTADALARMIAALDALGGEPAAGAP